MSRQASVIWHILKQSAYTHLSSSLNSFSVLIGPYYKRYILSMTKTLTKTTTGGYIKFERFSFCSHHFPLMTMLWTTFLSSRRGVEPKTKTTTGINDTHKLDDYRYLHKSTTKRGPRRRIYRKDG